MKAELLSLTEIISKFPPDPVVSLSGAGGKTTLVFRIAREIKGTVIVTTTTKVGFEQILSADRQILPDAISTLSTEKVIWTSPSLIPQNGKIIGFTLQEFGMLAAECREKHFSLISEADGAACRHIKAPAAYEPVIPADTNVCFYLAGLDVTGKPVSKEYVHRPEIFSKLTGARLNEAVTPDHFVRLFDHPEGGLRNMPPSALRVAYLTHADTEERISAGKYIAENLKYYHYICLS